MLTFVVTLVLLWNLWIVHQFSFLLLLLNMPRLNVNSRMSQHNKSHVFSVDCHMEVSSLWCNNICKWTTMPWPDRTRFNQLTPDCGCLPPNFTRLTLNSSTAPKEKLTSVDSEGLKAVEWNDVDFHSATFIYLYQTDVNFIKYGLLWVKGNSEHSSDVL